MNAETNRPAVETLPGPQEKRAKDPGKGPGSDTSKPAPAGASDRVMLACRTRACRRFNCWHGPRAISSAVFGCSISSGRA